jgi:L-asparaginase
MMAMTLHIFTTGGTIDKVYFDQKSEYEVGVSHIASMLSEANVVLNYECDVLMQKDSLDITEEDRQIVYENVEASPHRHILITHGTDTMIDTAKALKSISDKTIVFVGSMQPARFKSSDAEFNVGFAIAAAQTLPPGVYIAMNGRVFNPDKARKNRDMNRFEEVTA